MIFNKRFRAEAHHFMISIGQVFHRLLIFCHVAPIPAAMQQARCVTQHAFIPFGNVLVR